MAYTTIDDPEAYFQVKTYTGTGSSASITLDGDTDMQPDLVWIKERGGTQNHIVTDAVRGTNKNLYSDTPTADATTTDNITAFGSDGFTVAGAGNETNGSDKTYVAWCWKESATAGFDIVAYTGTGSTHTQAHSLSAVPHMIIFKNREGTNWWTVYHHKLSAPADRALFLNNTYVEFDEDSGSETLWNDTVPTSSVFTVGDAEGLNTNTETQITYLWTAKQGYSRFGKYIGRASNFPFIYTGFKPAMLIIKGALSGDGDAAQNWELYDNKRNPGNGMTLTLFPNTSGAESDQVRVDFLSNGFKIRQNSDGVNDNDSTYIYMAFAEAPFVNSNGVPCNAR